MPKAIFLTRPTAASIPGEDHQAVEVTMHVAVAQVSSSAQQPLHPPSARQQPQGHNDSRTGTWYEDEDEDDDVGMSFSNDQQDKCPGRQAIDPPAANGTHHAEAVASRRTSLVQDAMDILESCSVDLHGILEVMKLLPDEAPIQSLACEKLWVHSWDDDNAIGIGRVGGISLVLDAMTRFPSHHHLQQCAAETLQNLASINEHNCHDIVRLGGVSLIVQAMMRNLDTAGTPSLQVCGCLVIASLAETLPVAYRDEIIRDGGADAVLHAARCFADLSNVCEASAQALQALGYNPNAHIIEF